MRVLLTQGAHYRGTADFVERYGASVWAPPRAAWRKIPNPATTDELPRGVEAIELDGEPQQVVFFIREHATLVSGDVLSGTGGRLHVFVDEADPERLLPCARRARRPPDRAGDHPARRPDPLRRRRTHPSGSCRGTARLGFAGLVVAGCLGALAGVQLGLTALGELAEATHVRAVLGILPDLLEALLTDPLPLHRSPRVSL